MALLTRLGSSGAAPGSPKALQRFQNCISFLWPSLQAATPRNGKATQIDVIDCFTNELVTRKTKKWEDLRENLVKTTNEINAAPSVATTAIAATTSFSQGVGLMTKSVIEDLDAVRNPELGLDIRSLSQAQLDNLLLSTLEIKNKLDFLYLIKQCIAWKQLPSREVLIASLKYLSSLSKLAQIDSFIEICRVQRNPLLQVYAGLAPFKAMALWRSGNADAALATLSCGYDESAESEEGRRMLRVAFRTIAEETLSKKSEAVLVALLNVARNIYEQYRDIFVLACVWKQCFISVWFCDQKSASLLFEEYEDLQSLVGKRSSSLCSSFLRQNNVDAVHRLIEVFLQYKQREACANCLSLLFNYQYYRSDLRACAEIIKSCSELEMPLSESQNEQFLSLFLNQTEPTATTLSVQRSQKAARQFSYKF